MQYPILNMTIRYIKTQGGKNLELILRAKYSNKRKKKSNEGKSSTSQESQ